MRCQFDVRPFDDLCSLAIDSFSCFNAHLVRIIIVNANHNHRYQCFFSALLKPRHNSFRITHLMKTKQNVAESEWKNKKKDIDRRDRKRAKERKKEVAWRQNCECVHMIWMFSHTRSNVFSASVDYYYENGLNDQLHIALHCITSCESRNERANERKKEW